MSALSIQPTYPIFTDIDGQPLESGYIWIGVAGFNPISNPASVYWDAAQTMPAAQPIRTLGGYPMNSGTPARLYVNSDYSIRVMNKNGSTVYSAPAATERYSEAVVVSADATNVSFTPAGSGAVTTNVAVKLDEWLSVKDFGAVGDGVNDDAPFINAAITAAITAGGGIVYFPRGQYRCNTRIGTFINVQNLTLLGYGAEIQNYSGTNAQGLMQFGNAALDAFGMYSVSTITVNQLRILGIKFTSSNTFNPATQRWNDQMPISLNTAEDVIIRDCYFENWDFAAIDFGAICRNAVVDACSFYSSRVDAGHTNYGVRAFCYANYTSYSNGNGDLSPTNPSTGILKPGYVLASPSSTTWGHENIRVTNCYFENVSHGVMLSAARRGVVSNNRFKNMSTRSVSLTTYSQEYLCANNVHSLDTTQQTSTGVSVFYGLGQATYYHKINDDKFEIVGATNNATGFGPIKCYFNSHNWMITDCQFNIPTWSGSGGRVINVEDNSDGEFSRNHMYCPNVAHPVSIIPTDTVASPGYQQQKIWVTGNIFEAFNTGAIQVWDTTTAPEPIVIKDNIIYGNPTRFVAAKVDVAANAPKLFLQGNQILGNPVRYIDNVSTFKAILQNVDVLEFKTRLSTGGGVANPSTTAVSFDFSSYFLPACFSNGAKSYDFTTYGGRENGQASTDFIFAITGETGTSISGDIIRNAGVSFQLGYVALTVRFFGLVT